MSSPDFIEVAKELIFHYEAGRGVRSTAEDVEWVAVQFRAAYAAGYADGYAAAVENKRET